MNLICVAGRFSDFVESDAMPPGVVSLKKTCFELQVEELGDIACEIIYEAGDPVVDDIKKDCCEFLSVIGEVDSLSPLKVIVREIERFHLLPNTFDLQLACRQYLTRKLR
ncbi:MAG: hypothetical protein K2X29_10385 [Candidatus Obscuribacterales bacterium]|nr:hypothetical protein [Candidatus Obscuribacterales bacterium]